MDTRRALAAVTAAAGVAAASAAALAGEAALAAAAGGAATAAELVLLWQTRDRALAGTPDVLWRELDRSRRHAHPLAVVRLAGAPDDIDALVAATGHGRETDGWWVQRRALFLVLPETDRDGANAAVTRLLTAADRSLAFATVAVFPEDGVTAGALLDAIEADAHRRSARVGETSSVRELRRRAPRSDRDRVGSA
jgi:hypothetical protein